MKPEIESGKVKQELMLELPVQRSQVNMATMSIAVRVVFDRDAFKVFYVDDPECDMDDVYHAFNDYFQNRPWVLTGSSVADVEKHVVEHIWPYEQFGDYLIQRWINEGMAGLKSET